MDPRKKLFIKLLILFLTLFTASFVVQNYFKITVSDIQLYVSSFGPTALIIYIILLILGLTVPFNPLPDYAVVATAAALFPPVQSIFATFVAQTITLFINYSIGKKYGWRFIDFIAKEQELDNVKALAQRITPRSVFGFRWLLPITAIGIDVISLTSGMANMNFGKFFLASIIPWTVLSVVFFTSTNYLKQFSGLLFFLPSVVLIVASLVIFKFLSPGKVK